jgi:hypothetical protein
LELVTSHRFEKTEFIESYLMTYCFFVDSKLVSSIEFALCLDTLGASSNKQARLTLHTSRTFDNSNNENNENNDNDNENNNNNNNNNLNVKEAFEAALVQQGAVGGVQRQRIVVPGNATWQHEAFARRRIASATLAERRRAQPPPMFNQPDVLARVERLDGAALRIASDVAMHTLTGVAYGIGRGALAAAMVVGNDAPSVERRLLANARLGAQLGVTVAGNGGRVSLHNDDTGNSNGGGVEAAAMALATALARHAAVNDDDAAASEQLRRDVRFHSFTLPAAYAFTAPRGTAHVYQGLISACSFFLHCSLNELPTIVASIFTELIHSIIIIGLLATLLTTLSGGVENAKQIVFSSKQ